MSTHGPMPLTPTPTTSDSGEAATSSRLIETNASHQIPASISTCPGSGRSTRCGRVAWARIVPSRTARTPFELDVPMSTPTTAGRALPAMRVRVRAGTRRDTAPRLRSVLRDRRPRRWMSEPGEARRQGHRVRVVSADHERVGEDLRRAVLDPRLAPAAKVLGHRRPPGDDLHRVLGVGRVVDRLSRVLARVEQPLDPGVVVPGVLRPAVRQRDPEAGVLVREGLLEGERLAPR